MAESRSSNPFRRKANIDTSADLGTTPPSSTAALEASAEPSPADVDRPALQPNTSDYFRQHLQSLSQANEPPPSTTFQKPKVVKKVRVQSPPPSSPESTSAAQDVYSRYDYRHSEEGSDTGSAEDDNVNAEDPFRASAPPLSTISNSMGVLPASPPPISGQPPNPFKKTLEDIEQGVGNGAHIPHAPATPKGSLDVDAFRRLLMTGQAPGAGTAAAPTNTNTTTPSTTYIASQITDAASLTDASSVSRQSILEQHSVQETPRTSHEISEAEGEAERLGMTSNTPAEARHGKPATLRKKPPPPSSRHGKLINAGETPKAKGDRASRDAPPQQPPSSSARRAPGESQPVGEPSSRTTLSPSSDANNPHPPSAAPLFRDHGQDSVIDHDSASKVPEAKEGLPASTTITPRPPTPPNAVHANTIVAAQSDTRKPAPPPPRTRHHRTESQTSVTTIPKAISPAGIAPTPEESMRRSSQDSTLSRSSSTRGNSHAPAPPPPRRPTHVSRPSTSSTPIISPTNHPGSSTEHHIGFAGTTSDPASPLPSPLHHQTTSFPSLPKAKSAAPPPPPSRHSSIRSGGRPASVSSFDATSRRVTGVAPPPPPPKRSRQGSGRGSSETGASGRLPPGPVPEEPALTVGEAASPGAENSEIPPVSGSSEAKEADVLADFEALQREIDALRGKYEKR